MSDERLEEIRKDVMVEGLLVISEKDFWYLNEQTERVQELEKELTYYKMASESYVELEKRNKRYREVLEFYADIENYKPFNGIFLSDYQDEVDKDGGEKARKALEATE